MNTKRMLNEDDKHIQRNDRNKIGFIKSACIVHNI